MLNFESFKNVRLKCTLGYPLPFQISKYATVLFWPFLLIIELVEWVDGIGRVKF